MIIGKYKDWNILNEIPEGWKTDNTVGSPLARTVFITNGKSVLNGQQRALLLVNSQIIEFEKLPIHSISPPLAKKEEVMYEFPEKEVNTLARERMKTKLLADIAFDLQVCELEGWDKKEYIMDLQNLLNGFI